VDPPEHDLLAEIRALPSHTHLGGATVRRQHDARSQQTRDEEISQHARGHGGRAVGGTMRDPKDQTQAFRHPRRQMPVHRDQQPEDQER
jgi:hypothetical protein